MTQALRGKVGIVTGSARGLGRKFAERMAAEGACIIAGDILDCKETVSAVIDAGSQGISVKLDVTDTISCQRAAADAINNFGRIDILVNNAALYGGLKGGRFENLDSDEWNRCMDVNVTGQWNCCKAVVSAMRDGGGGSIINIRR